LTGGTTRPLALIEKPGVGFDQDGNEVEGPVEALLGTVADGTLVERKWMDPVTENPTVGTTEVWELYNTTADAHPMHIHEVAFEVVNRQSILVDEDDGTVQADSGSAPTPPESWETGVKDTVIAYPGQVTRLRLQFPRPGQFVWHATSSNTRTTR
jgi:FtsP/CotA-like multicopper oxidase with cupredoxin domain